MIAGLRALALLVLMLVVDWYGSHTGWQSLAHLRWLALVTSTLSVIVTVIGLATVIWLACRAISPGPGVPS
jgi:uncharacterized membrane protein YbhN (UPF0104 family)